MAHLISRTCWYETVILNLMQAVNFSSQDCMGSLFWFFFFWFTIFKFPCPIVQVGWRACFLLYWYVSALLVAHISIWMSCIQAEGQIWLIGARMIHRGANKEKTDPAICNSKVGLIASPSSSSSGKNLLHPKMHLIHKYGLTSFMLWRCKVINWSPSSCVKTVRDALSP